MPPRPAMWPGQRAFRNLARADARELLQHVDARLDPEVFLVGVRAQDHDGPALCVEPAGVGLVAEAANDLGGVLQAPASSQRPARGSVAASDPRSAAVHVQHPERAALQAALQRLLAHAPDASDLVSVSSLPQPVGGYLVSVVVRLERRLHELHAPALHAPAPAGDGGVAPGLPTSLLEATIAEFLGECALALTLPDLGRFGVLGRELPDVMRSAGKKLMHAPGAHMHGMLDLFDVCNMISTMRYEGSDSAGALVVAPRDAPGLRVDLAFRAPVSLRDYRKVRKLLETTGPDVALLCADGEVYGLGSRAEDGERDAHFEIEFTGHHAWRLRLGPRVLMDVHYGQPHLPKERLDGGEFRRVVQGTFTDIAVEEVELLWSLVSEATRQRHGTMVVVSPDAEGEAARLGHQAIPVEAVLLTPELVRQVTAIDGALLVDPHNRCHAIGTILDGRVTAGGDPSRGARYNSAIRYVQAADAPCLAIIVSEDGMVDVVSNRA